MCDYAEATNSLLEAGCEGAGAAYRDKEDMSARRACCKIFLAVVSFIISAVDLGTDWYNYIDYKDNVANVQISDDGADFFTDFLQYSERVIFVACILGSVTFLLEFICFCCNIRYGCKRSANKENYTMFEEIVSFLIVWLEDLPMLLIFFVATVFGFCPLVKQVQSLPGRIAICASSASTAWRVIQSFNFSCNCRKCTCCGCCCGCFRAFRAIYMTVFLILSVAVLMIAFQKELLSIGYFATLFSIFNIKEHQNLPVYMHQTIGTKYFIQRYVNDVGYILPPPKSAEELADIKGVLTDIECDHYTRKIELTDSSTLMDAGEEGIRRRFKCSEVTTYLNWMVDDKINTTIHNCYVVVHLIYDGDRAAIYYNGGYELYSKTDGTCISSGSLPFLLPDKDEQIYYAPPLFAWTYYNVFGLNYHDCRFNKFCNSSFGDPFLLAARPKYQCAQDSSCTLSTESMTLQEFADDTNLWFSQFIFRPNLFDHKGNIESFPCQTGPSYKPEIELGLCENVSDPEEDNHTVEWLVEQYTACPESWFHDQWTLNPATNLPYNNAFYSLLK